MGNSLTSGFDDGLGGGCCEPKVDAISVLVAIGAIAAISAFLRQAVIDNNIMAGRKKRSEFILKGNQLMSSHC